MALMPWADPSFKGEKKRRIAEGYDAIAREMDADAECRALGSSLNFAYREILPGRFDSGHIYVYDPAPQPEGKPVILFLHGSLGNFKSYVWSMKPVADRVGVAIVTVDFGLGNWQRKGGAGAIERARQWCAAQPGFDAKRIYLAGISNGGRGLVRAASEHPDAYAGLISVSGYWEPDKVSQGDFLQAWNRRPVLLIQGSDDLCVPTSGVRGVRDLFHLNGVDAEYVEIHGADHFMFFTHREKAMEVIVEWLQRQGI